MAARLTKLSEHFSPGLILADVPGRDGVEREYTVPLASAELGLWCQTIANATMQIHRASTPEDIQQAVTLIEDLPEMDDRTSLERRVLGDAYTQMMTDGVSHQHIAYCAATAYAWILGGDEAAERYWTSGGVPGEAVGPAMNRADRRANQRAGSSPTTSTGGATTTPRPASGRTTNSRRGGRGRGRRGGRSSTTGT
ncbi:hypothetical protein E0H26_11740 [Micromonospora zingiberis]|uniref:DUF7426 domain-containing protein n=1 Tax=Micromonospora zingiberis TaxID=2053011 RepID=A0A4R0GJ76_9ACTN|nr:hypothetical protein [Micromonospora zingiberis]TCB97584.1 hypothetical protein E0H26_11740 [Micromonospora zingiberis]